MILPRKFFNRDTLKVAQELLGCILVRKIGKQVVKAVITETEAYKGENDLASHASKGRTPRTELMFGEAGYAYIYLIYGMYYCFNIVTEKEGYPAAVLIRGVELFDNQRLEDWKIKRIVIGPGKVCRELKIDKSLNGVDLVKSDKLYITRLAEGFLPAMLREARQAGSPLPQLKTRLASAKRVKKLPRVGVDYAGEYKDKQWRFILED